MLFGTEETGGVDRVCAVPYLTAVVRIFVNGQLVGEIFLQQHVHLCREALQGVEVEVANGCCPILQDGSHAGILLFVLLFLFLDATHAEHIGIGQEEMVHLIDRAVHTVGEEFHLMGSLLPPLVGQQTAFACGGLDTIHLVAAIHLQPSTNDGVAHRETVGKEWCLHILVYHVEPERELAQLDGCGIEVHAIDVVRGYVSLHLLQLVAVVVGSYAPVLASLFPKLLLLVGEVSLCHLVDYLVLEGGSTHGRFKDFEFEKFGSRTLALCHLVDDAFERIFHGAACEHFGGVVGCRLLTVATVESIDKRAFGQNLRIARLWVTEHLTDVEVTHAAIGHEKGAVLGLVHLVHLYIVLLSIESTERQQALIDTTQLVHAQIGIAYAPTVVLLFR